MASTIRLTESPGTFGTRKVVYGRISEHDGNSRTIKRLRRQEPPPPFTQPPTRRSPSSALLSNGRGGGDSHGRDLLLLMARGLGSRGRHVGG